MPQSQDNNPAATTRDLASLEEAVSEFLKREEGQSLDPWTERLRYQHDVQNHLRGLAHRLGPRYYRCTLANFEVYDPKQQPVLNKLREFAAEMPTRLRKGGGLILLGPPGTGKDHLLAALLKIAVAHHRFRAVWWDGGVLFDEIHESLQKDSFHRFHERLLAPHILAISDPVPPRGYPTDSQLRRFRDIIDRRYRQTKSIWITTNVDAAADAEELFTKPLLERIKAGSLQVFCDWPSYRTRGEVPK